MATPGFEAVGIRPTEIAGDGTVRVRVDLPYERAGIWHRYPLPGDGPRCHRVVADVPRWPEDTDATLLARAEAMAAALREGLCPWLGGDGRARDAG